MADETIRQSNANVANLTDREFAKKYALSTSYKCKSFAFDNGTDTKSPVFMSELLLNVPSYPWLPTFQM